MEEKRIKEEEKRIKEEEKRIKEKEKKEKEKEKEEKKKELEKKKEEERKQLEKERKREMYKEKMKDLLVYSKNIFSTGAKNSVIISKRLILDLGSFLLKIIKKKLIEKEKNEEEVIDTSKSSNFFEKNKHTFFKPENYIGLRKSNNVVLV